MGEQEVRTADSSGSVTVASAQSQPQPKSTSSPTTSKRKSARASGTNASKQEQKQAIAQGRPVTVWDNPDNDPNDRKHVGEDPEGKDNSLGKVPGE